MVAIPESNYDDIDYVMIPEGLIKTRVEKMAHDIFNDYSGRRDKPLRMLVVMNGAFQFYTDVLFHLKKMSQYSNINTKS